MVGLGLTSATSRTSVAAGHGGRRPVRRCRHTTIRSGLVLVPTGDGSSSHLKESVTAPGEYSLGSGSATLQVGGAAPADLVVDVPTVSSRHATLTIGDGKVQVTDLGSMNGTSIGGQRLKPQQPQELPIGAEISFGDDHLALFKLEDRPANDANAQPDAQAISDS